MSQLYPAVTILSMISPTIFFVLKCGRWWCSRDVRMKLDKGRRLSYFANFLLRLLSRSALIDLLGLLRFFGGDGDGVESLLLSLVLFPGFSLSCVAGFWWKKSTAYLINFRAGMSSGIFFLENMYLWHIPVHKTWIVCFRTQIFSNISGLDILCEECTYFWMLRVSPSSEIIISVFCPCFMIPTYMSSRSEKRYLALRKLSTTRFPH